MEKYLGNDVKNLHDNAAVLGFWAMTFIHLILSLRYVSMIASQFYYIGGVFFGLTLILMFGGFKIAALKKYLKIPFYMFFSFLFWLILFSIYFISIKEFSIYDAFIFLIPLFAGLSINRIFLVPHEPLTVSKNNNIILLSLFMLSLMIYGYCVMLKHQWVETNKLKSDFIFAETFPKSDYAEIKMPKNRLSPEIRSQLLSEKIPEIIVNKIIAKEWNGLNSYLPFAYYTDSEDIVVRIGTSVFVPFGFSFAAIPLYLLFAIIIFWYGNILNYHIKAVLDIFDKNIKEIDKNEYAGIKLNPLAKRNALNIRVFNLVNEMLSTFHKMKVENHSEIKRQKMEFQKHNHSFEIDKAKFLKTDQEFRNKINMLETNIKRMAKERSEMATKYSKQSGENRDMIKKIESEMQQFVATYVTSTQKTVSQVIKTLDEINKRVNTVDHNLSDSRERSRIYIQDLSKTNKQIREVFDIVNATEQFQMMSTVDKIINIIPSIETNENNRLNVTNEIRQSLNTTLFALISLSKHVQTSKILDHEYIVSMLSNIETDINKTTLMLINYSENSIEQYVLDAKTESDLLKREQTVIVRYLQEEISKKENIIPTISNSVSNAEKIVENNTVIQLECTKISQAATELLSTINAVRINLSSSTSVESAIKQLSILQNNTPVN